MKWNPELYKNKHSFVFSYGESLIDLLAPQKEESILDLGCGTGELSYQISEKCIKVVGMDKSEKMINKAKSEYPEITFIVGDASDFQFDNKFDAIFSNATLHWVKQYQLAIKCMFSNLKTGGRVVLEFGGKGNVELIVNSLKASLSKRGYKKQSELNPWYFPTIGEYCTALENAGFSVTYAEHYDRPTKLADNQHGIIDWISMFGKVFFATVEKGDIEDISREVQSGLKPQLFREDNWYADYKRIRIIAEKNR